MTRAVLITLILALPLALVSAAAAQSCGSHTDDTGAATAEAKGTPAVKSDEAKSDDAKTDAPKTEAPKADAAKTDAPKTEAAQQPKPTAKSGGNPMVVLETNYGNIKIELFKDKAPISTENFLSYVRDGFYDGTIFHRVVPNFVIQAGGFTQDMKEKAAKAPIKNEAGNGLSNLRGTLSVARTNEINSGTTHFFINLVDNKRLDHTGEEPTKFGYAVFGKVTEGMDVVDKIAAVEVTTKGAYQGVPVKPVTITKAKMVGAPAVKTTALPPEVKEKKVEEKQIGEPETGSQTK